MHIHVIAFQSETNQRRMFMKTSSGYSFAKPLRPALIGAALFTALASAAEPASDPQALARELLNPTHGAPAISVGADPQSQAFVLDAQEQARRLLLGASGELADRSKRSAARTERSQEAQAGARGRGEGLELARRMILGRQA
jgi:hypothetical protein